jgi:hypothetical protein
MNRKKGKILHPKKRGKKEKRRRRKRKRGRGGGRTRKKKLFLFGFCTPQRVHACDFEHVISN